MSNKKSKKIIIIVLVIFIITFVVYSAIVFKTINPDLQTVGKNNVNQINWSLYLSDFGFSKTKLIIFSTFSR